MSIFKNRNATYTVRWKSGLVARSKTFKLKGDAKAFEAEVKLAKRNGEVANGFFRPAHGVPTFAEYVPIWMKNHAEVFKAEGGAHADLMMIRRHLLPVLADALLTEITVPLVTRQIQAPLASKRSPRTVNSVTGLLKKMMKDAVYFDLIKETSLGKLKLIKDTKKEIVSWTKEELARYLAWATKNDPELFFVVSILTNTGMRRGEAEVLERQDIDFDLGQITLRRSYCYATRKVNNYTKGRKQRLVTMNDNLRSDLRAYVDAPPETKIFQLPMLLEHFGTLRFSPSCEKAGVKRIGLHGLRHTFASHLAMSGVPVSAIQNLLGHTTLKMTERYMHLAPSFLDGITSVLNRTPTAEQPLLFLVPEKKCNKSATDSSVAENEV
jgi:integrase